MNSAGDRSSTEEPHIMAVVESVLSGEIAVDVFTLQHDFENMKKTNRQCHGQ